MEKNKHRFLFEPGRWEGKGVITLNMVEEELKFTTNWTILEADFAGKIPSVQEIQIHGISESMRNELDFYDFTSTNFIVDMDNANIGKVQGKGVYDEKMVAWEFRNNPLNFEGFEAYHLQQDGSYRMHAEYVTSDQFRTEINGTIFLITKEEKKPSQDESES